MSHTDSTNKQKQTQKEIDDEFRRRLLLGRDEALGLASTKIRGPAAGDPNLIDVGDGTQVLEGLPTFNADLRQFIANLFMKNARNATQEFGRGQFDDTLAAAGVAHGDENPFNIDEPIGPPPPVINDSGTPPPNPDDLSLEPFDFTGDPIERNIPNTGPTSMDRLSQFASMPFFSQMVNRRHMLFVLFPALLGMRMAFDVCC